MHVRHCRSKATDKEREKYREGDYRDKRLERRQRERESIVREERDKERGLERGLRAALQTSWF